jgi:hypothetical protein
MYQTASNSRIRLVTGTVTEIGAGTDSMLTSSTVDSRRARSSLRVVHFEFTAQAPKVV